MLAAGDITAPSAPTSLAASAIVQGIRLTWINPTDADLAKIEIFEQNTASPAPSGSSTPSFRLLSDTFTRAGLAIGTTRYYWVRAVDASGNASAWAGPVNAMAVAVNTTELLGQIQAAQIAAGLGGGNLLSNSAPSLGAETVDWALGFNNTGLTSFLSPGFDPWRPPGGGSVYISTIGTPSFSTQFEIYSTLNGQNIPVKPGQRYELSAYLSAHRCSGAVEVAWYLSDGSLISFDVGSATTAAGSGVLSNWGRSTLFATAPATATGAKFIVRGFSFTGSNPYVFIANAYFGEALANQTEFSFWSASGISTLIDGKTVRAETIGAGQLAADSVIASKIAADQVTAVHVGANKIISTSANLGDAVVTTLKIGANEVTVPTSVKGANTTLPSSGAWTDLATLTVTTAGYQPSLVFCSSPSPVSALPHNIRLLIDGVVKVSGVFSLCYSETLAAGSHTIKLQGSSYAGSTPTVNEPTIAYLESKR